MTVTVPDVLNSAPWPSAGRAVSVHSYSPVKRYEPVGDFPSHAGVIRPRASVPVRTTVVMPDVLLRTISFQEETGLDSHQRACQVFACLKSTVAAVSWSIAASGEVLPVTPAR